SQVPPEGVTRRTQFQLNLLKKFLRACNSSVHAPRRNICPAVHSLTGPCRRQVGMTSKARIRNLVLVRHSRRDELERVAANVNIRNRLLNLRHMAIDALATGASCCMVRVLLDRRAPRPIGRTRIVASQAKLSGWLD